MNFTIYEENNKNILKLNILDEKICNYDCIFCPIGRGLKTDNIQNIDNTKQIITSIEEITKTNNIDMVFINSMGEALLHNDIQTIIDFLKEKNLYIKLLSNGYLLGIDKFKNIANLCNEVVGELKTIKEDDFHMYQRPIENYKIENLINNMAEFKKQYSGKFILEVTILNTINNNEESLLRIKEAINRISPDKVNIEKETNEIFIKKYGISDEELEQIKTILT